MGRAQRKARAARAAPHSLAEPFTAEPCSRTVPPSAADRSAARTGCVRFLFWSCSALLFVVRGEVRRRYGEPRFPCSSRSLRGKHRRQVAPDLLFFFCYLQGNTGRAAESPERRCASIGSITCAVPVRNGARSTHARMIRPRGSGDCDLRQRGRPWPRTSPRQNRGQLRNSAQKSCRLFSPAAGHDPRSG